MVEHACSLAGLLSTSACWLGTLLAICLAKMLLLIYLLFAPCVVSRDVWYSIFAPFAFLPLNFNYVHTPTFGFLPFEFKAPIIICLEEGMKVSCTIGRYVR